MAADSTPAQIPSGEPGVPAVAADSPEPEARSVRRRLWLALVLGLPLIAASAADRLLPTPLVRDALGPTPFLLLQAALAVAVVLFAGRPELARGWLGVRRRRPNALTLVALGVGAALVYSLAAVAYQLSGARPLDRQQPDGAGPIAAELGTGVAVFAPYQMGTVEPFFETAVLLVILSLLGRVAELRARERVGDAVRRLVRLAPPTARVVLPDGREEDRPVRDLRPGDQVRVPPGGRSPVDGIVTAGVSTFDESMITGEPTAVEKGLGATVLAGTQNGLRPVTVATAQAGDATLLHRVVALVEQAQHARTPLARQVDRAARWLVPLAVLAAAGTFAGWAVLGPPGVGLSYAGVCCVGVLIAACPVALGLAAPLAVAAGVGRAARHGILFRDPAALERLAGVDAVLFDKTGTLTEGRHRLVGVTATPGHTPDEVLALAAAVERGSEHLVGRAIVWEAVRRGLTIVAADVVEAVPGQGVRGVVAGRHVAVGSLGFVQQCGMHFDLPVGETRTQQELGRGVVVIARDGHSIGLVTTEDAIRASSRPAVEELAAAGARLVLVTGDHGGTAKAVAAKVGILEVVPETVPAEKYALVLRLRNEGRVVAMCGDGTNDAPALAAADVGIALGCGTDVAVSAAGVTLVKPDLRGIAAAVRLSRATVRTVNQNLALAFAFNVLAIPVAAGVLVPYGGGLLSPVWAAAVMAVSTAAVLVNSLRLARFRVA